LMPRRKDLISGVTLVLGLVTKRLVLFDIGDYYGNDERWYLYPR